MKLRINIKALCRFRFPTKKAIKNLAKFSERTGSGYLEAARGSGSSGCAAQLKWDWDSSKGVPQNTRNGEQICPQAPSGVAKNQIVWRVTIHEQKAGTSGNPEWRTIKGSVWKNLQPSRNGFCSLGKNDSKKDSQKLRLKGKKPWKKKRWRLAFQGHPRMES